MTESANHLGVNCQSAKIAAHQQLFLEATKLGRLLNRDFSKQAHSSPFARSLKQFWRQITMRNIFWTEVFDYLIHLWDFRPIAQWKFDEPPIKSDPV